MTKKLEYFYMRMSQEQKEELKRMADKKNMTMTQYVWHLVIRDKGE